MPGNPDAGEPLRRVPGQAQPRVPFDRRPCLAAVQIDLIEKWIARDACDARRNPAAVPVGARVRLHGNRERGGRLDSLDPVVGVGMCIDEAPIPGACTQARGRVDDEGRIVMERVRPR